MERETTKDLIRQVLLEEFGLSKEAVKATTDRETAFLQTTNTVRQILINELGLSRESIRREADSIVESTTRKHFETMLKDGRFTKLLQEILEQKIESKYPHGLKGLLLEISTKLMSDFLGKYVKIVLKDIDENQ